MGCKQFIGEENERKICEQEDLLGYSSNRAQFNDYILRKYSSYNKLNVSQFADVANELGLRIRNFSIFYETLVGSSEIDLQSLLILGIYLGKGDLKTKSLLLFQVLDTQSTGQVRKTEFSQLFDLIADIFVNKVRFLLDMKTNLPVYEYLDKCFANHSAAKDKVLTYIFNDEDSIDRAHLMENIPLSTSDLRQFYLESFSK